MYIKHYLSEPDVRFPPRDLHSISAFMQASQCAALSHLSIPWDQESGTGYMGTE